MGQSFNITFTKNLLEVLTRNPNALVPIYDPTTGRELDAIKVSTLIKGDAVDATWSLTSIYDTDEIVEWNNKFWKSKVDNNEGNQPAENTFWTEVSASVANGSAFQVWSAGVFTVINSTITVDNVAYLLRDNVVLPFESIDFNTELLAGQWVPLGTSVILASESEAKSNTENTKYLSSLRSFQQWLQNTELYNWGSKLLTTDKTIIGAINENKSALANKADLVGGLVPSNQLPGYVDDVIEVANYASLPAIGETGKIYVTIDNNNTYRWSGSTYVSISNPISFASQPEAEGNTENTKVMTSLHVFQNWINNIRNYSISDLLTTAKTVWGSINEIYNLVFLRSNVNPGVCQTCPIEPIDIVIDHTTRTLTIATIRGGQAISASNPIKFYCYDANRNPIEFKKIAPVQFTWTDTLGLWHFYFDNSGNPISTLTPWSDFKIISTIFRLYWSPTETGAARIVREAYEVHLNNVTPEEHSRYHKDGAKWMSGLDLINTPLSGNAAPNASGINTCCSLNGGVIYDDNMPYAVINSASGFPFNQDLGNETAANITISNGLFAKTTYNDNSGVLKTMAASRFPFYFIGNVPQVISANGTITPVVSGNFFNYYIYAFQDPRFGEVISLRSGGQYASQALAEAETWETIKALSPTLRDGEARQLYRRTNEYKSTWDNAVKGVVCRSVLDIRGNAAVSVSAGGGSGASIASNVSVTPPTGYTSTDMQGLSNEFGAAISKYSESETAPISPKIGDEWLDVNSSRKATLYKWFIDSNGDGYWVDWGNNSTFTTATAQPVTIPYTTAIPFTAPLTIITGKTLASNDVMTIAANPVEGYGAQTWLISNGTNVPNFAAFDFQNGTYSMVAGVYNLITMEYLGSKSYVTITPQTAI